MLHHHLFFKNRLVIIMTCYVSLCSSKKFFGYEPAMLRLPYKKKIGKGTSHELYGITDIGISTDTKSKLEKYIQRSCYIYECYLMQSAIFEEVLGTKS